MKKKTLIEEFDYKPRSPRSILSEMELAQLYPDRRYVLLYEDEWNTLKNNVLSKSLQILKDVAGEEAANQNVSEYYSGYNAKRQEILDLISKWE